MNAPLGWVPGLRVNLLRWQNNAPKREPGGVDVAVNYMAKRAPKKAIKQATNVPELAARVHAQALRRYGQAIFDAHRVYEAELERLAQEAGILVRDVPKPPPEYRVAQTLLGMLGLAFQRAGRCGEFSNDDKRKIGRVGAALRPKVDARTSGEAIEIAMQIIHEVADFYHAPRGGWSDADVAGHLALRLTCHVHPGFCGLRTSIDAVQALLARHIPGTPRKQRGRPSRRGAEGQPTRLTSAGILCELNKLPRDERGLQVFPLGRGLSPNSVGRVLLRKSDPVA